MGIVVSIPEANLAQMTEAVLQDGYAIVQEFVDFVGIDVVGDKVEEINAESPGGMQRVERLYEIDVCPTVIEALERHRLEVLSHWTMRELQPRPPRERPSRRGRPSPCRVWEHRRDLHDALDALPQSICHQDLFPRNAFIRVAGGAEQTVAIDWAFCGSAALGADLAPLLGASLGFFEADCDEADELERLCMNAYLDGLRLTGWQGHGDDIFFGYLATIALRFMVGAVGPVLTFALDNSLDAMGEQIFGHPKPELIARCARSTSSSTSLAWRPCSPPLDTPSKQRPHTGSPRVHTPGGFESDRHSSGRLQASGRALQRPVSAMRSSPVAEQLQGRLHALGEELIGQVTVCERPSELERAEQ